MKTTCDKMVPVLAVLAALAAAAAVDQPKPRGQQIHLFEATVSVPDSGDIEPEDYNYRLLAKVLGRSPWFTDLSKHNHRSK
jgi:hypothetical protein